MAQITLIPIGGLQTAVPADDPSLLQPVGEGVFVSHDTGGQNVDYAKQRNAVSKSSGKTTWSNSAMVPNNRCHGLFELDDGTNRDNLIFESGRIFYYDGTPDPVQLQQAYIDYSSLASGPVAVGETVTGDTTATQATVVRSVSAASGTLYVSDVTGGTGNFSATESLTFSGGATANCDSVLQYTTFNNSTPVEQYSTVKFGSYVIIADNGTTAPVKWQNGDANLTQLITDGDGTLYKFRYLTEWYNRIFGAYSNQTNGDLEIRWTSILPTFTDLSFAAADQLYKPGTDSISGISKLGVDALLIYGTDSISRVQHYTSSSSPFGIVPLVQGQGSTGHHCIVNAEGANFFFNKNYGFVRYIGGSRISRDDIISRQIEDLIRDIDSRYYGRIVGRYLPHNNEVAWLVPQGSGQTEPNRIFYYNTHTGTWRRDVHTMSSLDAWTRSAGERPQMVCAHTNGHVYEINGDDDAGSAWDGHRIEPILDFGSPQRKKMVTEVWFSIVSGGAYSLDLSWRTGDTVKELLAQSWTSVGSLSTNNPDPPVIYCALTGRLIQFKWGTDLADEPFAVNRIVIRYDIEGKF